jgi:hypothetical protein
VISDPAKRNVLILVVCQALYMTGTSLMIATGPLAGQILTPTPGWETLPLAAHHAGDDSSLAPHAPDWSARWVHDIDMVWRLGRNSRWFCDAGGVILAALCWRLHRRLV